MIDDNINHEYIIRYLRDLLPKRGGLIGEMEQYARENSVPISQPETMKLLEVLIPAGGNPQCAGDRLCHWLFRRVHGPGRLYPG